MLEALLTRIMALEEDSARNRAENDELRKRVNTLQADTSGGSSLVDTKPLSRPTESEEDEDWTRFSLDQVLTGDESVPRYRPQARPAFEDCRGL